MFLLFSFVLMYFCNGLVLLHCGIRLMIQMEMASLVWCFAIYTREVVSDEPSASYHLPWANFDQSDHWSWAELVQSGKPRHLLVKKSCAFFPLVNNCNEDTGPKAVCVICWVFIYTVYACVLMWTCFAHVCLAFLSQSKKNESRVNWGSWTGSGSECTWVTYPGCTPTLVWWHLGSFWNTFKLILTLVSENVLISFSVQNIQSNELKHCWITVGSWNILLGSNWFLIIKRHW